MTAWSARTGRFFVCLPRPLVAGLSLLLVLFTRPGVAHGHPSPVVHDARPLTLAQSACHSPVDAWAHVGEQGCVEGVVTGATWARRSTGQPTFLDFGPTFVVVIWIDERPLFDPPPETWRGQRMRVSGLITSYREKAQIIVREPAQLRPAGSVAPSPPPVSRVATATQPAVRTQAPPTAAPVVSTPVAPVYIASPSPTPSPLPTPVPAVEPSPSPPPSPTPMTANAAVRRLTSVDEAALPAPTPAVAESAGNRAAMAGERKPDRPLLIAAIALIALGAAGAGWYGWKAARGRESP